MDRILIAMLFRNKDNDCEIWFPEIPLDEPLLQELFKKYETSGGSTVVDGREVWDELIKLD